MKAPVLREAIAEIHRDAYEKLADLALWFSYQVDDGNPRGHWVTLELDAARYRELAAMTNPPPLTGNI